MAIRIVVVDDHELLREALCEKLNREVDLEIVGDAGTAKTALRLIEEKLPDIVLLDIGLPDMNGVLVAKYIHANQPSTKIIALSMYADNRLVTEMLIAGAKGYVTKTTEGAELLKAVRTVATGKNYLCHEVAGALIDSFHESAELAPREREVLRLLAEGLRSHEIAKRLHIAIGTVDVHRRNIMRKLDLHNVADLTKYAIRDGIISI